VLTATLGLLLGALVTVAVRLADVQPSVAIPAGVFAASVLWVLAATIWNRDESTGLSKATGILLCVFGLAAAVDTVNQALTHPILPDATGLIVGVVLGACAAALWAAAARRAR